jgi:hypothetical protein
MKESGLGAARDAMGPRTTLKLKTPGTARQQVPDAPLKTRVPAKTTVIPARTTAKTSSKTNDWADEHKQRMQADMDALGFGSAPVERGRGS